MVKRFPVILAVLPLSALSYGVVIRVARTEPGKGSRIFEPSSIEFATKAISVGPMRPSGPPPSAPRSIQPVAVKVQWRTPSSFTAPAKQAVLTPSLVANSPGRIASLLGSKSEDTSPEKRKLAWLPMLTDFELARITAPLGQKPAFEQSKDKPASSPIPFEADTTYPYAEGFKLKEETLLARVMGENESSAGANPLRLNSPLRVVPEPASFLPLAVGAAALIRRRKSARV